MICCIGYRNITKGICYNEIRSVPWKHGHKTRNTEKTYVFIHTEPEANFYYIKHPIRVSASGRWTLKKTPRQEVTYTISNSGPKWWNARIFDNQFFWELQTEEEDTQQAYQLLREKGKDPMKTKLNFNQELIFRYLEPKASFVQTKLKLMQEIVRTNKYKEREEVSKG